MPEKINSCIFLVYTIVTTWNYVEFIAANFYAATSLIHACSIRPSTHALTSRQIHRDMASDKKIDKQAERKIHYNMRYGGVL